MPDGLELLHGTEAWLGRGGVSRIGGLIDSVSHGATQLAIAFARVRAEICRARPATQFLTVYFRIGYKIPYLI